MEEQSFYIKTSICNTYCCYKAAESDTLIIMLHGLGGTRNSVFFRDLPTHTSKATLRFDLDGHGRSDGEFSFSFKRQTEQFNELMQDPRFSQYPNRIIIGHSKGANLALLCARPYDTVICAAGRFKLDEFPEGTFLPEEQEKVENGEILDKEFCGKHFFVNKELMNEFKSIDNDKIIQDKHLRLFVLAGQDDELAPPKQQEGFSKFAVDGIHYVECTHFDFKLEKVWDVICQVV